MPPHPTSTPLPCSIRPRLHQVAPASGEEVSRGRWRQDLLRGWRYGEREYCWSTPTSVCGRSTKLAAGGAARSPPCRPLELTTRPSLHSRRSRCSHRTRGCPSRSPPPHAHPPKSTLDPRIRLVRTDEGAVAGLLALSAWSPDLLRTWTA
jgi:hypothetical protein